MKCDLCPRLCGADRQKGNIGYCGASGSLKVARAALHMWEEPVISGENGSGTVFFSNCPLKCVYCQNKEISSGGSGLEISVERLSEIFLELEEKGAHNINLVSPTQYTNEIIAAVACAKEKGLSLPIVYNTSGYERVEVLEKLSETVDIYLTDFKYMSSYTANKYSHAASYPTVAKAALREMIRQQPKCLFDGDMLKKGVIVRHLVLPCNIGDSKDVIDEFANICGDSAYLSLMRQYTPPRDCQFPQIARSVTDEEYDEVVNYALLCGVKKIFLQEKESVSESFIPAFDYEGVLKNGT